MKSVHLRWLSNLSLVSKLWSCFLEERDFRMAKCAIFELRPGPLFQLRLVRALVQLKTGYSAAGS